MKLTWAKANTETWLAPIGCAPKDLQNLRLFASLFCCSFYAMDISDKQTQHDWLMMTLKARVIVKEILSIQNRNSSKALPDGESPLTQHHFHGSRFAVCDCQCLFTLQFMLVDWAPEVHSGPFKFTPVSVQIESNRFPPLACAKSHRGTDGLFTVTTGSWSTPMSTASFDLSRFVLSSAQALSPDLLSLSFDPALLRWCARGSYLYPAT